MFSRFRRVGLAAALLCGLSWVPAHGQVGSVQSVDDLVQRLTVVQDESLTAARQIVETERSAAADLQTLVDAGRIVGPIHQRIARTFVANALSIAAAMLSPVGSPEASAENIILQIQRNMALVQAIGPTAAQDGALSSAMGRYTLAQLQARDAAVRMRDGWNRYAEVIADAREIGLFNQNAYDPQTRSWTLAVPSAVAATLPTAAAPVQAPEPEAEAPVEPVTPSVAPEAEAPPEPAPEDPLSRLPPLPGEREGDAPEPLAFPTEGTSPSLAPVATPEQQSVPALPDTGPPAPGQRGDWTIALAPNGRATARTANLNADTEPLIHGLTIRCAADGGAEYAVDATQALTGFRVYADQRDGDTVAAVNNVITGPDAAKMAEILARAYQWARQVPAGRGLTLRVNDATGALALFSADGYLDARAAVLATCGNAPTPAAGPAAPPEPSPVEPDEPDEPLPDEPELEPIFLPSATPAPAIIPPPEPAPEPQPPQTQEIPEQTPEVLTPAEPVTPEVPAVPPPAPEPVPAPTPPPAEAERPSQRPLVAPIPMPRLARPLDIMSGV